MNLGNNIQPALEIDLVRNSIADMQKTMENQRNIPGWQEYNPIINAIGGKDNPGMTQLYGLLASLMTNEVIKKQVPKDKQALTLLLANLVQAGIAGGMTKAPQKVTFYSHKW